MPDCTSGEFRDVDDLGSARRAARARRGSGRDRNADGRRRDERARARAAVDRRARPRARVRVVCRASRAAPRSPTCCSATSRRRRGRLPISVPRNAGQIPMHHDHRAGGGRSVIYGDYVDSPAVAALPLRLRPVVHDLRVRATLGVGEPATTDDAVRGARSTSTQHGRRRAGTEVVQLLPPRRSRARRAARPPARRLRTRRRSTRASRDRASSTSTRRVLAYYDEDMRLVIEPGTVRAIRSAASMTVDLDGGPGTRDRTQRPPSDATATTSLTRTAQAAYAAPMASTRSGSTGGRAKPTGSLDDPEPREIRYTLFSTDDHLVEPPHMFEGRLPAEAASARRRKVVETEEGHEVWHVRRPGLLPGRAQRGRRPQARGLEGRADALRGDAPRLLRHRRAHPRHGHQRRVGVGQLPVADHRLLRRGVLALLAIPSSASR